MIICGIDLETTGLDAKADVITEVGAILWDTELNHPVKFFNKLLKIDRPVPENIVKLTGITDNLLNKYGEDPQTVWKDLESFVNLSDGLMAHNAPFDKGFLVTPLPKLNESLWIDSSADIDFPEDLQTRKLTYLAAEHGFVNPFSHRALTDVLTMFQVASNYDWNETVSNAKEPKAVMRAMVTIQEKDKAKNVGYRFNQTTKFWTKSVRESKVNDETIKCKNLGFLSKRIG